MSGIYQNIKINSDEEKYKQNIESLEEELLKTKSRLNEEIKNTEELKKQIENIIDFNQLKKEQKEKNECIEKIKNYLKILKK